MFETPLVTGKRLELSEVHHLSSEVNTRQRHLASDLFSVLRKYLSYVFVLLHKGRFPTRAFKWQLNGAADLEIQDLSCQQK